MTDSTQKPDDEFASAFAELQTPAPSTPTAAAAATAASDASVSPSASAPAAAEATPSAAAAPTGAPEGNASATSVPATPAAGAEAGTPTAAQPAVTLSAETPPAAAGVTAEQFAALQAELAELKKAPAAAPAPAAAAEAKPVYTAEEQQIVDDYLKEWPDTAKGEALMRRAEYQQLVQYVWQQFAPRLDALEQVSQRTSTRTQYQELKELVPDYDAVRDSTLAWIDKQPAYLKDAYQRVANEGSAKDVADLITRFKKETSYVAPAAPATPSAAAAPAGVPAPAGTAAAAAPAVPAPAAAAAAAALKPVATSRSTPVSTPDPNDFDAAFKEFAAAG